MKTISDFKSIFKESGLRFTKSRAVILDTLLKNQKSFLTIEELFLKASKKKESDCDQTTVYRTLLKLEELGLVQKGIFHGEAAKYRLKVTIDRHEHEHFFKCIKCSEIETFHDCRVSSKEQDLIKKGYSQLIHHLEIYGLCPSCS